MMSSDRHDRLLPLYFSRPIGRGAYVWPSSWPPDCSRCRCRFCRRSYSGSGTGLLATEPLPTLRASLDDLGRIVVAGTMIAFYLGAIGLTISSFTGRKSVAVGVTILGFVLSESLAVAILQAFRDQPDLARWSMVISPSRTTATLCRASCSASPTSAPMSRSTRRSGDGGGHRDLLRGDVRLVSAA